jgi:hypothetical protein
MRSKDRFISLTPFNIAATLSNGYEDLRAAEQTMLHLPSLDPHEMTS